MPSSSKEGKFIISEWITKISSEINTVLDLGVGEGTYHKFFYRKNPVLKHAKWIGVEVWQPYIELYNLKTVYDQIEQEDIRYIDYQKFGEVDLVFAGDVLEHMTKDEAISLIKKLSVNAKRVIISIPIVHYPQGEVNENPFEKHIKDDWSHQEMIDTFPQIVKHWQGNVIGVYFLNL